MKLIWIGIGTKEPERMYASVNSFHEALTNAAIDGYEALIYAG